MRKAWLWLLGIVLVSMAVAGISRSLRQEPTVGGRPIRNWAREIASPNRQVAWAANQAFNHLSDPLPICVALLEIQPTQWEKAYTKYWPQFGPKLPPQIARLFPPPRSAYEQAQFMALKQLEQLGSRSTNAIPALIALIDNPYSRQQRFAVQILGRMGRGAASAVPRLTQILEEHQRLSLSLQRGRSTVTIFLRPAAQPPRSRHEMTQDLVEPAIIALGQIGVRDRAVMEALLTTLTSQWPPLRFAAANALWKLEPQPQRLLPVLTNWLAEPGLESYRRDTVRFLAQIAETDRQALRILEERLQDKDLHVRLIASQALWKLDGQMNTHVRVLCDLRNEGTEEDRWSAVEQLSAFVSQHEMALPAIVDALKDESNRLRGKAAITLGKLGPAAAVAIPSLTAALEDAHSNVREAAREALAKIQAAPPIKPATAQ